MKEHLGTMSPDVYVTRQAEGHYAKLEQKDLVDKFLPYLQSGSYYISNNGVITRRNTEAQIMETPWDFVKITRTKQCHLDNDIKHVLCQSQELPYKDDLVSCFISLCK
jgi:hypothetical protein